MITVQANTKITAPQTIGDLLFAFRSYTQKDFLTGDDLYEFLTVPSREREVFLDLQNVEYKTDCPDFIEVFYS